MRLGSLLILISFGLSIPKVSERMEAFMFALVLALVVSVVQDVEEILRD